MLILLIAIPTISSAKCNYRGIYFLSKCNSINKNALIILEFYASSQKLVKDLNIKYPIYFKSKDDKVLLNPIETFVGEMNLTQVIFKPKTLLKAGQTYTLEIENLPYTELMPMRYNGTKNKAEPIDFKVNDSIDIENPILENSIIETKKTIEYYGCGPEKIVHFKLNSKDKSECFAKVTVRNKSTNKITTYILRIENQMVSVGHGMCSGAFHFDNGDNFEATFQLIDQSGNYSSVSKIIAFTKPTDANSK